MEREREKYQKKYRVKDEGEWVYIARNAKTDKNFESVKLKGSLKSFNEKPSLSLLDILAKLNFTSVARRCSDFHYKLCTHGQQNSHMHSHSHSISCSACYQYWKLLYVRKCEHTSALARLHWCVLIWWWLL